MNYWLTTHWPPRVDDPDQSHRGIWIRSELKRAGRDLRPGDLVLIYETRRGKEPMERDESGRLHPVKRCQGDQGIVAVAEVLTGLKDRGGKPTVYRDRSKIWWQWLAETRTISERGFVPLKDVNRILHYKKGSVLHGFGDLHSGLKKLKEETFRSLHDLFQKHARSRSQPAERVRKHRQGWRVAGGGEESERHRLLKEFVAMNPSAALGIQGLKTLHKEFVFPTNDKADLVLKDRYGRLIGVEVEDAVAPAQLAGLLQAVKYRFMLAVLNGCSYSETRAFLIADSLSSRIRRLCTQYHVEPFVVPVSIVRGWAKKPRVGSSAHRTVTG